MIRMPTMPVVQPCPPADVQTEAEDSQWHHSMSKLTIPHVDARFRKHSLNANIPLWPLLATPEIR